MLICCIAYCLKVLFEPFIHNFKVWWCWRFGSGSLRITGCEGFSACGKYHDERWQNIGEMMTLHLGLDWFFSWSFLCQTSRSPIDLFSGRQENCEQGWERIWPLGHCRSFAWPGALQCSGRDERVFENKTHSMMRNIPIKSFAIEWVGVHLLDL